MTATHPRRDDGSDDDARISAYTASPERTVFTEQANPDGWIATDLTVDVSQ
jgi:hypothetical protein